MHFHYVYILQSVQDSDVHYVRYTENLSQRLAEHNSGKLPNTSAYRPWLIKSAHALADKTKALRFERYLKSGSGRSFAKRHL